MFPGEMCLFLDHIRLQILCLGKGLMTWYFGLSYKKTFHFMFILCFLLLPAYTLSSVCHAISNMFSSKPKCLEAINSLYNVVIHPKYLLCNEYDDMSKSLVGCVIMICLS